MDFYPEGSGKHADKGSQKNATDSPELYEKDGEKQIQEGLYNGSVAILIKDAQCFFKGDRNHAYTAYIKIRGDQQSDGKGKKEGIAPYKRNKGIDQKKETDGAEGVKPESGKV